MKWWMKVLNFLKLRRYVENISEKVSLWGAGEIVNITIYTCEKTKKSVICHSKKKIKPPFDKVSFCESAEIMQKLSGIEYVASKGSLEKAIGTKKATDLKKDRDNVCAKIRLDSVNAVGQKERKEKNV